MFELKDLKELGKDFRVLYVEDDISIQSSMVKYLDKFFLKIVTANDGEEGLLAYEKERYDIVITDLSMPKMNGLDMLREIKKINKEQAVLITTAHSEADYMFETIKIGIDGYIIKPFDYEQLNQELYKIADRLKKAQENEQYKNYLKDMVEEKTFELTNLIKTGNDNYEKTIYSMVKMIEDRDSYTAGHSKRVAQYCQKIAQHMGYSETECTKLYQAGILHDIGKVTTPDSVLLNPKELSPLEYKLIQKHVEVSFKLISSIPMLNDLSEIVYSHHEQYNGKGYPRGLSSHEIDPLAAIMILADAFDAMTTNRIYKAHKSIPEAIEELIKLKSIQFHPEVVDSAVIVLKDITLDNSINQLPKTELEEERFSYFYKDTLGDFYNQNYLDVVLMKNSYEKKFKYIEAFFIENFNYYNKKYGWNKGNELLNDFATLLKDFFKTSFVFRMFGDDFIVVSIQKHDLKGLKNLIDKIIGNSDIECHLNSIDLSKVNIENTSHIENVCNMEW
jgi:putative nucleotidyltransferase with HDIG domain